MFTSRPIRIVAADSDSLAVDRLCAQLSASGYLVIAETTDGHEIVSLARQLLPDVVVMGIELQEMDGLEASRQIDREAPCPIVLLGERSKVSMARRASAIAAVQSYLIKPKSERSLEAAIEWALASYGQGEQLAPRMQFAQGVPLA
jgi:AmiR/NasT family two-component response regulator